MTDESKKDKQPEPPVAGEIPGAWGVDERFGLRLDQTFNVGDRFMLYGAKPEGIIKTDIGDADVVGLLVQRLDDAGRPTGMLFKVNTLARAIVEKMSNAVAGDFPAIVELGKVHSKRFNREALVLTKVGDNKPEQLLDEFQVPQEARPQGVVPY